MAIDWSKPFFIVGVTSAAMASGKAL